MRRKSRFLWFLGLDIEKNNRDAADQFLTKKMGYLLFNISCLPVSQTLISSHTHTWSTTQSKALGNIKGSYSHWKHWTNFSLHHLQEAWSNMIQKWFPDLQAEIMPMDSCFPDGFRRAELDWSNGSVIKNIFCSWKQPEFSSHQSRWATHL